MPAESWRMYPARTRNWCEATSASAGTSLRVGVKDLDILMHAPARTIAAKPRCARRLALPLQLPIDHLLDLLVRLRSVDEHPVDEEGRRPVHARRAPRLHVLFDQRLLLAAVQALVDLRDVDPHRLRVPLQVVHREL